MTALEETLQNLTRRLLAARNADGHWEGRLASSALSTATAAAALSLAGQAPEKVDCGLHWLARHQNADGGWGDTVLSLSNISTTSLCWAAFSIAQRVERHRDAVQAAEAWLQKAAGGLDADRLSAAIIKRYGNDRTFSVPILTVLALAGKLDSWRRIPQLPFELAVCPHRWFQWVQLPVVSYALPALIAIGQVRHCHAPTRNPLTRWVRSGTKRKTLQILESIQPSTGGFLEATPLTSFVVMSLAASGQAGHAVVRRGAEFLIRSMREDGSWPIDTNLATWVTTLSVNALAVQLDEPERKRIRDWLLRQQYRVEHPYTHAAPGGWAWTDLPGGVPDADDTSGALLALKNLGLVGEAAIRGVRWLLDLQNRDGGIPTFCRGWGKLPFDRSSPDLTAHALLAWNAWLSDLPQPLKEEVASAVLRAKRFLERTQRDDGSWAPLWFGNQFAPEDENPTYGTARVLMALDSGLPMQRGIQWLLEAQNADGGWGGAKGVASSIEETALAIHALASHVESESAVRRGAEWLIAATERGLKAPPSPIGFYFARLWYFEELYPLIFATAALSRAHSRLR